MDRRSFLIAAAALPACARLGGLAVPLRVERPGMAEGHALRDLTRLPVPSAERRCELAVFGSGVAGLTAAWRLAREGVGDVLLVTGPETYGNAAGGRLGDCPHPRGSHYLPLPSRESAHVREILAAAGVILGDAQAEAPEFDERVVVHPPDERLYVDGGWQSGLLPEGGRFDGEAEERRRFHDYVAECAAARGDDGRRAFAVPAALASGDERWRRLDRHSFAGWLDAGGFRAPGLRWYLDYVCRDEYGGDATQVSAWAGLNYFAARSGRGRGLDAGALLTWPDGLAPLARLLAASTVRTQPGAVLRLAEHADRVEALVLEGGRCVRVVARRAVCAMPLQVAARVVEGFAGYGCEPRDLPAAVPWLVANLLLDRFPDEPESQPLAWDNVVFGSPALGYVVSTHQLIRAARPAQTVFTTYRSFAGEPPGELRRRLATAGDTELAELALVDLAEVYGPALWRHARQLEICVRGHGMALPAPGFLSNPGLAALRAVDRRLLFAHADLSGYSVFEEAAWWGWQAAGKILG